MATVPVKSISNEKVGDLELDARVFEAPVKETKESLRRVPLPLSKLKTKPASAPSSCHATEKSVAWARKVAFVVLLANVGAEASVTVAYE